MASRSKWYEMDANGEWQCSLDSDDDEECATRVCRRGLGAVLPWNYSALERIVLLLADRFGFRIEMSNPSMLSGAGAAALVPAGLALAGGALGRHLGGRAGAAVGGAIGGAIGVGVLVVAFRDAWQSIKSKLPELLDIVFDYLGNLGVEDYKSAIESLTSLNGEHAAQLAQIIMQVVSEALGKSVLSTLPAA